MSYSPMIDFIIFGSPSRKSNSRINFSNISIPSKYATEYLKLFAMQIEKIKEKYKDIIPLNDVNLHWYFKIYYSNKLSDASIELIFDALQKHNIVTNDNIIRDYHVDAKEYDKITPRVEIKVYKL